MLILGNDKTKFGYYQVGDRITFSKLEAIEWHAHTGHHPHWNFNQATFSHYDWTQEPNQDLSTLYRARAQQIRDCYDHVVLLFSGGADSSNILDTFINNNIPFDEVLTFDYWMQDPDPLSYFHSEQTQVSWPRIKQLQDQGYHFLHRRVDLSEHARNIITDSDFNLDRSYLGSMHWGLSHVAKSFIRESVGDYQRLADKGRKVVFIWGAEKPRLYIEQGRFCVKFLDIVDSSIAIRTQLLARPYEYDELFYWAPETANLICKQAHVLMNYFKSRFHQWIDRSVLPQSISMQDLITGIFNNKQTDDGLMYRNLINSLIYPHWSNDTFTAGKPPSLILSPRDRSFYSNTQFQHQVNCIKHHLRQIDPYWLNDPQDLQKGIKGCLSPAYFLE